MGERLILHLPETVTTRFLVATDARTVPGPDYLADAVGGGGGLSRVAATLVGTPALTIEHTPPGTCRDRLRTLGGAPDRLAELIGAARHLAVTTVADPAGQPRHAQATRLLARTLAAATGGVAADLDSSRLLPVDEGPPTEPDRFVPGRDWVSVFIASSEGGPSLRVETAGLHRFGLPEVMAGPVPYASMLTAANLVRGLAWQLLAEHTGWASGAAPGRIRHTAAERVVRADDVMRFWGTRSSGGGALPLTLDWTTSTCPGCERALKVLPPGADPPTWWAETAAEAMPKLVHAVPDP
ncbi:hypothetical protein [Actinomadura litoris]|uniref:Uncharacterized protein n=1 Tax=Actinomadura litoris TaxID=2678616 RepID=A0A7K1LA98_9ACTN|nr:hypothetical protein [Actinomadura litoris]MUN41350.1 hypothetical protein [Actinomadura litoris]